MRAVVEHNPHDLTATLQAGLPLSEAQQALGTTQQWLALDPLLQPGATIGGVVATNATGARRLRYGGVRDQIIGVRVVLADGTIAKGGGKVVKNVAGYDLPKLLTGSLGTLGVVVAATFRLYPLPAASRTVVVRCADPTALCALAVRTLATPLVPTALDVVSPLASSDACALLARFESGVEAMEDQAARFAELARSSDLECHDAAGDEEASLWERLRPLPADPSHAAARLTLKASLLPTEVAAWLERLRECAHRDGPTVRWRAHAGHGIVYAHLEGAESALVPVVEPLRAAAVEHHGSLVVWDAPPALAQQVDVWGPSPALAMMRRLKASFDPHSTLNPGRYIGRI